MFVDRRGSREGKKTSLRQTDKAKKHATTNQAGAGGPIQRTCTPARLLNSIHAQPIFDAGCNLGNRQFENDFQRVVTRGVKEGVTGMVMVPNDFDKVGPAITLCKWLPGVLYCAAGIHPSNINSKKVSDKQFATMVQQLREKLVVSEVVAVLCGLDFSRDIGLRVPQEKFLREELKLAGELDLPVIFVLSHASQLSEEEGAEVAVLLEIIKECRNDFKEGLVHNFYGSESQLKEFVALGLHVSISGIITSERQTVTGLISTIPREKFLICTDSPYHTPQNSFIRESRNEPSNLPYVLQVCAKAYGITPKQLSDTIQENSIRFFNLNATATPVEETAQSTTDTTTAKKSTKDKKPEKKQASKKEEEEEESDEETPKGKIGKGGKGGKKGGKGKKKESEDEEETKPKKGQRKGKAVSSDDEVASKPAKKNAKKGSKAESSDEEIEAIVKPKKGQKQKGKRKEESSDEEVDAIVKPKKGQKQKGKRKEESSEEEEVEQPKASKKNDQGKKQQSKQEQKPTKQETKKKEETSESESEETEESEKEVQPKQAPIPDIKNLTIDSEEEDREDVVVEYACKMCRTKLFTSENLQAHQTAKGLKMDICKMYFLEPMDWMKKTLGDSEGRLECPKCEQKLGRFDATGISCTCGTTVKPAYKVVKSRVDVIGEATQSDSSDQEIQFGEGKKKQKKKKSAGRKSTKGNFSHFRNKDYGASSKKRESESDE